MSDNNGAETGFKAFLDTVWDSRNIKKDKRLVALMQLAWITAKNEAANERRKEDK